MKYLVLGLACNQVFGNSAIIIVIIFIFIVVWHPDDLASAIFPSPGLHCKKHICSYSVILFTSLLNFQTTVSFYYNSKYTNKTVYLLIAGIWLKINIPLNELEESSCQMKDNRFFL